ncbi:MAG: hypothetical protein K5773_06285 [Pseudobutyrivibrio sp.]|nr:hypothetical protein [Pseudobutyrivibrio sp.]
MAYFTRNRMQLMIREMADINGRFTNGRTGDDLEDIRALIDCQQKALVLGEYLESMGMDYSDIVSKFEEYCNMVYDISENLHDRDLVIQRRFEIGHILADIHAEIANRIIEISKIDIYDFRGLVSEPGEKTIVSKEITRLIDSCLNSAGPVKEGEEMYRPLVVGTY